MLVELGVVEQRYKAVSEVLVDGATVTGVARRLGVSRQTVHTWLRRYGNGGLAELADRSSRPDRCSHQTRAELEATIVTMEFILWHGAARFAEPGTEPHRLLVEEFETYLIDSIGVNADVDVQRPQTGRRLVYAETVPLDQGLLSQPPIAASSTTT